MDGGGESARLRLAEASDLPAVVDLLRRQLAEHDIGLPPATLERSVQTLFTEPELGRILIATYGDEVAGVALLSFLFTLEHGGPAAWLDELYVDERRRGQGLGARLVAEAMHVAKERGCVALDLEVEDGHDAATRLYERLGFHRHRRVRWAKQLR